MTASETNPPLSEDQACEVINRWSEKGFFRLRNMGDKIFVEEITRGVAYTIRLQTHYERRVVQRANVPYHGGFVDNQGRPPGRWDVPVAEPAAFEERKQVVPIPHTERVQMCSNCSGEGRVTCGNCMGQGRTTCLWCHGMGYVQHQVHQPTTDASGNTSMMLRSEQRPCTCSGGQVVCTQCHGNRLVTCSVCDGSGSVKTFDQLIVRFQAASQGELVDVTPVPDGWLSSLSGEVLLDERAPRIESCSALPEAANRKAMEVLTKSHEVDDREDRILLQHLHVQRIPIDELRYKYAGEERQLWICGNEQGVHAPKAPWNRRRLFALVVASAIAIGAAVGAIAWLVR